MRRMLQVTLVWAGSVGILFFFMHSMVDATGSHVKEGAALIGLFYTGTLLAMWIVGPPLIAIGWLWVIVQAITGGSPAKKVRIVERPSAETYSTTGRKIG